MKYVTSCKPSRSVVLMDRAGGFLFLPLLGPNPSRYNGWFVDDTKLLSSISTGLPPPKRAIVHPNSVELQGEDYRAELLVAPRTLHLRISLAYPQELLLGLRYDVRGIFSDPRMTQNYSFSKTANGFECSCANTSLLHELPRHTLLDGRWVEEHYPLDKSRLDPPFSRWVFEKEVGLEKNSLFSVSISTNEPVPYHRAVADSEIFTESTAPNFRSLPKFERAVKFAMLNCTSLIHRDRPGRFPWVGLPYFPYVWGRDFSIALNAFTATGRLGEVRKYLQHVFHTIGGNGRILNFIGPDRIPNFKSEDATWWMMLALERYVDYSGDFSFLESNSDYLKRIIEGGLNRRENGLISHAPDESWMDTPSTPRRKAIEIEALFANALKFVTRTGLPGLDFSQAAKKAVRATESYWNGSYLDDAEGDSTLRPNQLVALNLGFGDFSALKALRELEVPHGILSISPSDPRFCPQNTGTDTSSYHNGDVWPWMTSQYVSALISAGEVERAWALTERMIDGFRRGAIGHLPELYDATSQKDRGCASQLWSMSEFSRNAYEDYAGIRPRLSQGFVEISPSLPPSLDSISCKTLISGQLIELRASKNSVTLIPSRDEDVKVIIWGEKGTLKRRTVER